MAVTKFNFKMYRGDTATFSVNVTYPNGNVYPLTGCTLFFTAKLDNSQPDSEALISKVSTNGGIGIIDAANGQAAVILDPADTNNLPTDVPLFCDVQLETPGGSIHTVAVGKLTLLEDTTRRVG